MLMNVKLKVPRWCPAKNQDACFKFIMCALMNIFEKHFPTKSLPRGDLQMHIARHIVPQNNMIQHHRPSHLTPWNYPAHNIHNVQVVREGGGVAGARGGREHARVRKSLRLEIG